MSTMLSCQESLFSVLGVRVCFAANNHDFDIWIGKELVRCSVVLRVRMVDRAV